MVELRPALKIAPWLPWSDVMYEYFGKITVDMDLDKIVILKKDYLLERIEGEITVYHPTLTTAVYLNESGALIWELCDGKRTISDIVGLLSEQYPESRAQIETDVETLIAQLIENGIGELK